MASYEDRIRQSYPQLSPSLKRLANYILDNYIQASFFTATELAHRLDLDAATVVRFSQRVGYPGYPELQREVRDKVRHELLSDNASENTPGAAAEAAMAEVVRHTDLVRRTFPYEAAGKLLASLDEVERVILLADALARPASEVLASWLESAGYTIQRSEADPAALARAIAGAGKADLVLALAVTEETSFLWRATAEAHENGVRTAALVAAPSLEVTRYADTVIALHATPSPGLAQVAMMAAVYALIRMVGEARPGRFGSAAERAAAVLQRLAAVDGPRERRAGRQRRA
ncbi:MAG TPA: MurR/RpiR family transcriptional regulator [Anaerolineales bacterium]|nr:MurR/RpiR family transcriptional regulator [Anaerolineales bacterium]